MFVRQQPLLAWTNEQIKEGVYEWMNEWMDEWMDGCVWMNEWIWMNEWMDGCVWMNEWMDGSKSMNEWMNEWMDRSMNEWMNELMNEKGMFAPVVVSSVLTLDSTFGTTANSMNGQWNTPILQCLSSTYISPQAIFIITHYGYGQSQIYFRKSVNIIATYRTHTSGSCRQILKLSAIDLCYYD